MSIALRRMSLPRGARSKVFGVIALFNGTVYGNLVPHYQSA